MRSVVFAMQRLVRRSCEWSDFDRFANYKSSGISLLADMEVVSARTCL
eukprot:COSAG02_NODE_1176_length_14061_cov_96.089529_16_plen_48_part_00